MKKSKKNKELYYQKKAYYKKDKFFIVLIILFILLVVNVSFFYIEHMEKESARKKELEKQEELIKKKDRIEKIKYGDIIFLGDSITDYYDLNKYYNFPIVNSGVSGWTTDDVLNHLDEKVFQYNPKKLVLLIGTNDINRDKDSVYITSNIEKIVEKIKEKRPKVTIYIESLYPINHTDSAKINQQMVGKRTNKVIMEINKKLKKYCNLNHIKYIDMYSILIDKSGNLNLEYTKEGLHMSEEGYKVITKRILKDIDL